jgi:hypothetical protein
MTVPWWVGPAIALVVVTVLLVGASCARDRSRPDRDDDWGGA